MLPILTGMAFKRLIMISNKPKHKINEITLIFFGVEKEERHSGTNDCGYFFFEK